MIATGGFATMLAPESTTIEAVDEFLTLEGLRLIHRNSQPEAPLRRIAWLPKRSHGSATSASLGKGASARRCSPTRSILAAGGPTRLGRTDDGTSLFDIEPEEVRRKTTISAGLHHAAGGSTS